MSRQAILRVSRTMFEGWLLEGQTVDCVADRLGIKYDWLHKAILLPDNAIITGVSASLYFAQDQVAIRIACPDFVEVPDGVTLPEIDALLELRNGKPCFVRWLPPEVSLSIAGLKESGEPSCIKFRE